MVSLFFVVSAMLEFALVLLINRRQNRTKQYMIHDSRKKSSNKFRPKISDASIVKENVDHRDNGTLRFSEEAKASDQQNQEVNFLRKHLGSNDMKLSTDSVDMMACVLYLTFYIFFNLFYWM